MAPAEGSSDSSGLATPVVAVKIPEQKVFEGRPFPLVLSPAQGFNRDGGVASVGSWIKQNAATLERQLAEYGAVLLRGFPVATPTDFNDVVLAFGGEELPYIGGAAPRTNVVGRVFTSNESPPDKKIPFHHEMAQVPEYPKKLFFFCEVPPGAGGETPLLLSAEVTRRMEAAWPDFVAGLREKGLLYTRVLGEGDDTTSAIGRGWQSTFLTADRKEAEQRAAALGVTLEWLPDGSVKTVSGPLPALKEDARTGGAAWFNSMVAAYTGWQDSRNEATKAVTFGDGTPLPRDAVLDCNKIMEEVSVAVPWEKSDVLVIDNLRVQHSRRTFVPPRRVLASLSK